MIGNKTIVAAAAALLAAMVIQPAKAEVDFAGKTISLYAGGQVGGGVDVFSRTFMPFLAKHLPGHPTIIVRNMFGAGGMQAVVFTYNKGTTGGMSLTTMPGGPIQNAFYGPYKLHYDIMTFRWIGSLAVARQVCFTWHTSALHTIDDAKKRQFTVSTTGARSNSTLVPLMLNATLGTRFKPIAGYGGATSVVAVERGETDARCYSFESLVATHSDWLKQKKVRLIIAVTLKPLPAYPDVPYVMEQIKDPKAKAAMKLFLEASEITYPYALPPGNSDEIVKAYRTAFDEAIKDPAYLSLVKRQRQTIDPKTGAEVEDVLKDMGSAPADVVQMVKADLNNKAAIGKCKGSLCKKKKKRKKKQ